MSLDLVGSEALDLLCGTFLGSGMSRKVYECALMPGYVVKIEEDSCFQNIFEYETWSQVGYTPYAKWFAKVEWISKNGLILIQERTRPAEVEEMPRRLPVWLTDTKKTNYGIIKRNNKKLFVCHDYGTNSLIENGLKSKQTYKPVWYER